MKKHLFIFLVITAGIAVIFVNHFLKNQYKQFNELEQEIRVEKVEPIGDIECDCFEYDFISPGLGRALFREDQGGVIIYFTALSQTMIDVFNKIGEEISCPIVLELKKDGTLYIKRKGIQV